MTRRQRLESQILIGIKKGDNCYPVSPLVACRDNFRTIFWRIWGHWFPKKAINTA